MKKMIIYTLILLLVVFAGCSSKSQERLENEEKMKKLGENMGLSEEEIKSRIESLSDEELKNATKIIDDEGNIDTTRIFAELKEEAIEDNNKLAEKATLNEINIDCSIDETSSHIKGGSLISLNGIGITDSGEEVAMNNLDKKINIKIYDVKYETDENSYFKEFKKGDLIETIEGNIDDLMDLKESTSLLGVSYEYTYLLTLDKLDKSKIKLSKKYYDDEYEYNYERYPLWLDITYDNGKFREVLEYENYWGCEIYEFEEQINSDEPNNQIYYNNEYLANNVEIKDKQIVLDYQPYDFWEDKPKVNYYTGIVVNNGDRTIRELNLVSAFIGEDKQIAGNETFSILGFDSIQPGEQFEFKKLVGINLSSDKQYFSLIEIKSGELGE